MPLIVTPGELNRRAQLYHQLQQFTSAGLGIVHSLEQLKQNPPSRSYRGSIQQLLDQISRGQPLGESLRAIPNWLPEFDVTLVEAGEKSGRLDQSFRMLGNYYTERATIAKKVITALLYPAFLLHLTAAVMALIFFFWEHSVCLVPIGALLLIYVIVFIIVYATQNKHSQSWRSKVEFVLNAIPVVGTARRYLAIARLSAALEALISAGVSIIEAWELAARASGSIALQKIVESWRPLLNAGQTPAEILQRSGAFPSLFTGQYAAGEISGKLDETLGRLRDYYQDDGGRRVQILAQWIPLGIYLLVLIGGGIFVIWFWVTYYNKLWQTIGL